jgi:DNA relaxase NicK
VHVATIAWGGETQKGRGYVSLTGAGCSLVVDWALVRSTIESVRGRITRLDLPEQLACGLIHVHKPHSRSVNQHDHVA